MVFYIETIRSFLIRCNKKKETVKNMNMQKISLPRKVISNMENAVGYSLNFNGEQLTHEIMGILSPLMLHATGDQENVRLSIKGNIRQVLVNMCFDRVVDQLATNGKVNTIEKISNYRLIIGITCRYCHLESLLGTVLADSISATGIAFEIYARLTSYLEFIASAHSFKDPIGKGLLDIALQLSSYNINLRNIANSVMIENVGILLFVRNYNESEVRNTIRGNTQTPVCSF